MLSFFILTAATTGSPPTPSAELYDFLWTRVWQKQKDIFTASTHDQQIKITIKNKLDGLKAIWEQSTYGGAGNIALVVIDYGDDDPYPVPGLFLSKGCFENSNSALKGQQSQPVMKNKKTIIPSLPFISVYKKKSDLKKYTNYLKKSLSNYQNSNHILNICFCKILSEEIQNENDFFSQNWHHSEQGFLQWLISNSSSIPILKTGTKKYRIFILTYRDMCLRCSTTFFSVKREIEKLFRNNPVEIISMSIERHTDHLPPIPQDLVLDIQEKSHYHNVDECLIRGRKE